MNPDIWGVFHDGNIDAISGAVPGVVELHIDIQYLRAMFGDTSTHFRIRLRGCSVMEYQEYEQPPISDPVAIAAQEPEVLYVRSVEPLVLDCREGELRLSYDSMEVFLDSGEPVTYEQLSSASKRYWDGWSKR